ncbi:hypothetical protein F5148DRAFT_984692 [Russula earlei]|uniref:Uncharacterized protein n=1 Tax=Russula earlei TaxID=71964 RepID=A0ACC0U0D5_9AGAM|nr:hypothetical protein F5148DRAFT_984692 [Russula earlei]
MPKGLHLKKTPAEKAERELRKARRGAKKATPRHHLARDAYFDLNGRRPHCSVTGRDEAVDLDPNFLNPGPSTSSRGARGVPVAEDSFHEKLWDALGDDDRLETVGARLNEYAHVPQRWRSVSSQRHMMHGAEDDPALMNDDEYAEWVRIGMWRKRNAAAHWEEQRQQAAHAAAKAEAARTLKVKEEARWRARDERERRRRADARDAYHRRWVGLQDPNSKSADLSFGDIPWPVWDVASDITYLTAEAISGFLFLLKEEGLDDAGRARLRKEELRGTMLRFHPDKFEGRVIPRVKEEERAAVREGANIVTRAVAELMEKQSGGVIT